MATFAFLGVESEKEKGGVMIRTTKTKVLKRKNEAKTNGCVSYRS